MNGRARRERAVLRDRRRDRKLHRAYVARRGRLLEWWQEIDPVAYAAWRRGELMKRWTVGAYVPWGSDR